MPDSKPDVVVSGHICLDLLPDMTHVPLAKLPSPGQLFEVGNLVMSTGGCVSNTGLALHKLGVGVEFMTKVGDDMIGRLIRALIEETSPELNQSLNTVPGGQSSYTVVLSPENSDRIFLHCTGTNDLFGVQDIDFEQLSGVKFFHLGYPPILPKLVENDGYQLTELFRKVHAQGVVTSLDMTMPDPTSETGKADWQRILERSLPYVDVFVPSLPEILYMLRRQDFDAWHPNLSSHLTRDYLYELGNELIALGVAVTGFKLGSLGMYLHVTDDAQRFSRVATTLSLQSEGWLGFRGFHPVFEVDVVGTTGAGDSAYAGLIASLVRGLSAANALEMACAIGACTVEQADATSGILAWDDVQARIISDWEKLSLPFN